MLSAVGIGEYLTIEAAATKYGVTRDRLERAAREDRLPAIKLYEKRTGPWLVKDADVAHFLATVRRGPKPRTPKPAE